MNIEKKPLRKMKLGIRKPADLPCEIMDEFKEPDTWTIITALDRVLDMAEDSQLSGPFPRLLPSVNDGLFRGD